MSPFEQTVFLHEIRDPSLSLSTMYERMIERLYLTSSTRCIPRYTLEAARLRQRFQPPVEGQPDEALDE